MMTNLKTSSFRGIILITVLMMMPTDGSYGVSSNIAWNTTGEPISIILESGTEIEIPAYGWTKID
ncbi:MAG: hypothetical protein ABFS28_07015 [Bacteroidota bacterium]